MISPFANGFLHHFWIKKHMLRVFFFQKMSANGSIKKIQKICFFNNHIVNLSHQADYEKNIGIHDIQKKTFIKIDNKFLNVFWWNMLISSRQQVFHFWTNEICKSQQHKYLFQFIRIWVKYRWQHDKLLKQKTSHSSFEKFLWIIIASLFPITAIIFRKNWNWFWKVFQLHLCQQKNQYYEKKTSKLGNKNWNPNCTNSTKKIVLTKTSTDIWKIQQMTTNSIS